VSRASIGVGVAGIAAALALAATAVAADSAPTLVEANPGAFPDRAYVLGLPKRQPLTTAQVKVSENGKPVDSLAVIPAGDAVGGFATILVIDASNSMKGAPIVNAMAAGRAFAAKKPPNAEVGVIVFNKNAVVRLPPTRNRTAVQGALATTPALAEGTRIYDALEAARIQLLASGARAGSIVLLSDGADVGSGTTEEAVVSRLKGDNVRVFTVGLKSEAFNQDALANIAKETGATSAVAETPKDLQPLFADLGFRLGNEYLVLYRSLEKANRDVKVSIGVPGFPPQTASYRTPEIGNSTVIEPSLWERLWRSPVTLVAIVLGIVALLWYAVSSLLSLRHGSFRSRMGSFVHMGDLEDDSRVRRDDIRTLMEDADQSFRNKRFLRSFVDDCELADIEMSPLTLAMIGIAGGILLGVFLAVVVGSPWLFLVGIVVPLGIRWYVTNKVERKRRKFADDLPDNLDVLAQSLRAGHSLVGAIAVVSETATEPTKSEFARIVSDEQLGVPLDDALEVCVKRMNNKDLDQVAVVALIQRDAGGNAAEVIDQVAFNVRVRQELRRLARTMTAQGRMARWILTALPIGLFVLLFMMNKEYLSPLWETTFGILALILSAIMVTIGSQIIKRIVDIKV
jgi:tight adherence protein B